MHSFATAVSIKVAACCGPLATHTITKRKREAGGEHGSKGHYACTAVCLSVGPIGQSVTAYVTKACARRPGAAASVSRRRRERRTLLAGGGR